MLVRLVIDLPLALFGAVPFKFLPFKLMVILFHFVKILDGKMKMDSKSIFICFYIRVIIVANIYLSKR